MTHNEIFSMIKNKKDWTHHTNYGETVPEKTIKIKEGK